MTTETFCWFDPAEVTALAIAAASSIVSERKREQPQFWSASTTLEARCADFLSWMSIRIRDIQTTFLTNSDGLPIMGTEVPPAEVVAAASLMSSVFGVNANLGLAINHVSASLGHERILHLVFRRNTSIGALAVGFVTVGSLDETEKLDVLAALAELTEATDLNNRRLK